MKSPIKVALIGLDTSHAVEFPKCMQFSEQPESDRVPELRAVSCLAFETPFQNKEGIAKRRAQIEAWGVKVVESFDDAVEDVDAIMIELNDPSLHLEYFRRCAPLGKRIFLDKPMASNSAEAAEIRKLAAKFNIQAMSCSSLRYMVELEAASAKIASPDRGSFFGPLGKAPAGSSVVWYGVHTFEMAVRCMKAVPLAVTALKDPKGALFKVEFPEERVAVVDLVDGAYCYGGTLRKGGESAVFNGNPSYSGMLRRIAKFMRTGETDATLDEASAVTGALDAAERSFNSLKRELVKI